jgi:glucosylceramidase
MLSVTALAFLLASSAQSNAEWAAKIRSTTDLARWSAETPVNIIPKATSSSHIDLDTTAKLQTIDGFGGCFNELGWKAIQSLPPAAGDSVIKSLFDTITGCKFNICRMPIGSSDYCLAKAYPLDGNNHDADWYSLNETNNDTLMTQISIARDSAYLLQYIKAAMKYKPGLKIWGSPWSPPIWMKDNHAYSGGTINWTTTILNAYALYLEKAVQLYQKQGINFYALSFQNESTQLPPYPGCTWSALHHRDFIKLYLGPKFADDGINCEIWTPTMNCSDFSFFTTMLDDPLCASFIKTVCFQWAGYQILDPINLKYPNATFKLYQTEQECGSGETGAALWDYAVQSVFYNMKYYLDRRASSYMQWNMVLAPGGFSAWGWPQNAMITIDTVSHAVAYNPQYYVVKHFSYYVRPNAKKITTAGNFADQVSFQNPDGSIVVVLSNATTSATPVSITFGSNMINVTLPPSSFTTAVVSNSQNNVIYKPSTTVGQSSLLKVIRTGNDIVFTPSNTQSFDLQVLGINGAVKASFSSLKGGVCKIKAHEMQSGMYVLKGLINGKRYFSTLPIINN